MMAAVFVIEWSERKISPFYIFRSNTHPPFITGPISTISSILSYTNF